MTALAIQPFTIHVATEVLTDLRHRLDRTRPCHRIEGTKWKAGTDADHLDALVHHWRTSFDWRARERELNRFAHFKADVGGARIHFIHERGKGPDPFPLVLTHGYPDSFYRFAKVIPMLTDPASFGGSPDDAFDVVVPDLPGYGFSDPPAKHGAIFHVHDAWNELMTTTLGYARYGAHGGDWGGTVTELLARSHADSVVAIHLTDVPFGHIFQKPNDLTAAEEKFFEKNDAWMKKDGAYALVQSTTPQSLSPALNDSPAGLAAWIEKKFHAWTDEDLTADEVLTQVMIYWATQSIDTSFLPYFDYANAGAITWMKEGMKKLAGGKVPAAFALFPKDISHPPREWAERFFDVRRWTEMPRGGHFAAMEQPELLAEDLRAWFRDFRSLHVLNS